MPVDSNWWSELRHDFQRLEGDPIELYWTAQLTSKYAGGRFASGELQVPASHWNWGRVPPHVATRIDGLARKGALALGGTCEDDWYERIVAAHVKSVKEWRAFGSISVEETGRTEGSWGEIRGAGGLVLKNVIADCISLCLLMECGTGPEPLDHQWGAVEGDDSAAAVTVDGPQEDVGETRRRVIMPILAKKGFTRGGWALEAGVDPSVVYDYLAGRSNLSPWSRKQLAEALGLSPDELPS